MTTTKIITREFVIQPGDETLPAVTLDYAWSSFMNTYAVWPSGAGDRVIITRTLTLQAGNYYVTGTVDNFGSVNINGQYNISLYNFGDNISRTSIGNSTLVNHQGGPMTITISATNTGGPRGVAVTISRQNATGGGVIPDPQRGGITIPPTYSVGDLVWSTRSAGTGTVGRYQVTMPFRADITAYAWGAGGGGGGNDSYTVGGIGSPGLYNTTVFSVNRGDLLEVFVGSGGIGAVNSRGNAAGGAPGLSRININGDSTKSFNGGSGSNSGPTPWSGGGGGGGGASGVLVNNAPIMVAAGGGGGGGAGNDGNGSAQYARRDASINNNAMLQQLVVVSSNFNINRRDWSANYFIAAGVQRSSIERGHNLAVLNPSTLAVESYTRYDTWASPTGSGLEAALNAVPTGKIIVMFNADAGGISSATRAILQSKFGSSETATWGSARRSHAFIGIAGASFAPIESFSDSSVVVISKAFTGISVTDYRGENGQTKGGDGGGAGGGGGGYPGGQGGAVFGGDASGFAGQCGGNNPALPATTGTNSPYYKSGFSAGGGRSGGNGQNGRVVLLIEPISLISLKVAGEWEQVQEAFVKVGGAWKDVDTIYIKINDAWREINGSGQGDLTLAGNTQNYGTSTRSYS